MRALLLALVCLPALAIDEADICRSRPPGTGLPASGIGYVHYEQAGIYTLHGVLRSDGVPRWRAANTYGPILAAGRVEWTLPSGKREPIPTDLLYAPS